MTAQTFNGRRVVYTENEGSLIAEFNVRLHRGRSDYTVYATRPSDRASDVVEPKLTRDIIAMVLTGGDDLGVEEVTVKPYRLVIRHSRAVQAIAIVQAINEVLATARPFIG